MYTLEELAAFVRLDQFEIPEPVIEYVPPRGWNLRPVKSPCVRNTHPLIYKWCVPCCSHCHAGGSHGRGNLVVGASRVFLFPFLAHAPPAHGLQVRRTQAEAKVALREQQLADSDQTAVCAPVAVHFAGYARNMNVGATGVPPLCALEQDFRLFCRVFSTAFSAAPVLMPVATAIKYSLAPQEMPAVCRGSAAGHHGRKRNTAGVGVRGRVHTPLR